MKKTVLVALLGGCFSLPAWSDEVLDTIQVHFVCDTREGAREMALNVFKGNEMLPVGCRLVEDLQFSVVHLMGPLSSLEPVFWQNKVVYIGRVRSEFTSGYSAGKMEMLIN